MSIKKIVLQIEGMQCKSCARKIEKKLSKLNGVMNVTVNYENETANFEMDEAKCSMENIKSAIKELGYDVKNKNEKSIEEYLMFVIFLELLILLYNISKYFNIEYNINSGMSYTLIFLIGLATSFHCIGMCGGIMLSQSFSNNKQSVILYNIGRIISYTILGGIMGLIGSLFNISGLPYYIKTMIMVIAGIFMLFFGLNIIGIKWFRKITSLLYFNNLNSKSNKPSLLVGIMNGLMPCGPLQAMQMYVISTGSFIKGALSMLMFSFGTVPLMMGMGFVSTLFSKNKISKIYKLSGALIIILGLITINNGLSLSGKGFVINNIGRNISYKNIDNNAIDNTKNSTKQLKEDIQVIKMVADYYGYTPNIFEVEKGKPVKLIIDAQELYSCNNEIVIPSLNITKKLEEGENIIEFIPTKDVYFSCWMGMLNGVIKVK